MKVKAVKENHVTGYDANYIVDAKRVIEIEHSAMKALMSQFDQSAFKASFEKICQQLLHCVESSSGRVIVMGIGKSGHIGQKIAATLASTGTPSFFVHPAEACHGDLGMIRTNDTILMLSYSGESDELKLLTSLLKENQCVIIALTGSDISTLAKEADIHLPMCIKEEACPLGLAPTTSTTIALVLGDAIAVALLKARQFSVTDFARSHPAGKLGRRLLLKVKHLMHTGKDLPCVDESCYLNTALLEMTSKKLGMTTVTNQGHKLMGVVTDGDLRRALEKGVTISQSLVVDWMTKKPRTIDAETLVVDAIDLMEKHLITSLVVLNKVQQVTGVIHMHDILKAKVI